jgi:hypothetical protein
MTENPSGHPFFDNHPRPGESFVPPGFFAPVAQIALAPDERLAEAGATEFPLLAEESALPFAEGAGPVAGGVTFDVAALDAALTGFLSKLGDARQAVLDSIGGLGPAPWIATVAAMLTVYEIARRRREHLASLGALAPIPVSPS